MDKDLTTEVPTGTDPSQEGAGGQPAQATVSVKDAIGKTLNKQFASDEAALKAVKDTFSYVGMKPIDATKQMAADPLFAEDVKKMLGLDGAPANKETNAVDTSKFISKEQYEKDMFYSKKPEYAEYADILEGIMATNNVSREEAAKTESFKKVFEKATAYDKVQKSKSVLETNPRLGVVTDRLTRAKENLAAGNTAAAKEDAVAAVLEAYETK